MTLVKSAKHDISTTLDELREYEDELSQEYPTRMFPGNPPGTANVGLRLLDDAARAVFLKQPAVAGRFLTAALDCISAGARAHAAGLGVEIEFEIEGCKYRGAADRASDLADPVDYVRALTWAIALRAPRVVTDLMNFPFADCEKAGGSMDVAYTLYAAAWRSFWQADPKTPGMLEHAETCFDPTMLQVADPVSAARHSKHIQVMWALFDGDEARFNAALVEALEAHKAWWGRGTRLDDPEGLFSNQASALVVMARQRNLEVTVESDYMPKWLIEGRAPE